MTNSPQRQTVAGFLLLAVLAGPVTSFLVSPMGLGAQYLSPVQTAEGYGLAGAALLVWAGVRRERFPRGPALPALLVLVVPQLLTGLVGPAIRTAPALHPTPWGVAFFVSLAAPLWLALLSALQWIPNQVPRAVAGASIAGIGAAGLVVPGNEYAIALDQVPVAALHVLLGVLTVFSWAYARPRLAGTGTRATAGSFLLLTAFSQIAIGPILARDLPVPLAWRDAAVPLLLVALINAAMWWLWFWLLQRMTLAAFGMRALAAWLASLLPGFLMFGFLSWRVDAAVAISLAALVIALRARVADEQPLALGLADS